MLQLRAGSGASSAIYRSQLPPLRPSRDAQVEVAWFVSAVTRSGSMRVSLVALLLLCAAAPLDSQALAPAQGPEAGACGGRSSGAATAHFGRAADGQGAKIPSESPCDYGLIGAVFRSESTSSCGTPSTWCTTSPISRYGRLALVVERGAGLTTGRRSPCNPNPGAQCTAPAVDCVRRPVGPRLPLHLPCVASAGTWLAFGGDRRSQIGGRSAPKLSGANIKTLAPIAACHTTGHLCTVISLSAGSVSFTHIVKAAEPLFSTVMSAVFLKSFFRLPVYLTLIPIVVGVAMASMKELSFTWVSFLNAMASNTAFSMRAIFSKKQMTEPIGENMSAPNLYAVLTIMSFCALAPLALLIESSKIVSSWQDALTAEQTPGDLTRKILTSGLSYYLYNEVAFLVLNNVHPITHAVGNTIKRVVIIVASVFFFNTKMTQQSVVGSSVAIAGVLMYSLAKQIYK
eukprot:scaffold114_cov361-Pinguiococcus_pyrenoidosus.AAC.15